MPPETTILKVNNAPAAALVHHFVRAFSRTLTRSYPNRSSIAIRPFGPQVPANRLDQRSASLQFEQPSSTSTVSLSTVRRGGLSTSTTKSEARHERKDRRGPRSARPTGGLGSRAKRKPSFASQPESASPTAQGGKGRKLGLVEIRHLADEP